MSKFLSIIIHALSIAGKKFDEAKYLKTISAKNISN